MKIKEGKSIIVRLASIMGKIWGLKPSSALWLYKTVARPIVAYASLIWHKAVFTGHNRDKLRKFQRFALMQLGYFRHKTPGAALEVIGNVMPLDMHILYDATCSYLRTRGHEKFTEDEMWTNKPIKKGHRQSIRDFARELGFDHLLDLQVDNMSCRYNWNKLYKIDKFSYSTRNPKKGIPQLSSDCNIYTDGSVLGPYRSGAAVSVWHKRERYGKPYEIPLPNHDKQKFYLEDATIFQCEVTGVTEAANWLLTYADKFQIKTAVINVDSQACIKAIGSYKINSKLVLKAVQTRRRKFL